MTHSTFPYPSLKPFHRLNVHDSLTVTAQRWQIAHDYHRSRHGFLYQSMNQPGIVCGLGVKVIQPPSDCNEEFRRKDEERNEQRWLEIQPGIAIDVEGNPIVVENQGDRTYRLAAPAPLTETQIIYIAISYVEPEVTGTEPPETLVERFRFYQTTEPPEQSKGIELCRIQLQPGKVQLKLPHHPFNPQINEIDLRYRTQVQVRPQAHVRLGTIQPFADQAAKNFESLIQSLPALFPNLSVTLARVSKSISKIEQSKIEQYDLLYLTLEQMNGLTADEQQAIKHYVEVSKGLILLVDTNQIDSEASEQKEFPFALSSWGLFHLVPHSSSPLQSHPFLFTTPPSCQGTPATIYLGGGVVLITQMLFDAWSGQHQLPRHEIRAAQEFGINILHFAWQRRHFAQLLE
jgi:hypothetical protein